MAEAPVEEKTKNAPSSTEKNGKIVLHVVQILQERVVCSYFWVRVGGGQCSDSGG